MLTRFLIILIFCFLSSVPVIGQDSTENSLARIQEIVADILSQNDEELNYEEIEDNLYQLTTQPVQINTDDINELKRLFWLTNNQLINLQTYIKRYGTIQSIYEIPNIDGFTKDDAILIAPFISFSKKEDNKSSGNFFYSTKQIYILRTARVLETQEGFKLPKEKGFTGSPGSLYSRYHIYNNNFSAGITGDKDSGEEFFTGSNPKGFDFYSYHIQLNNLGVIKNIVLGDYKIQFGNGLIAGTTYNLGKTTALTGNSYQNTGITKYTATDENKYFRGIAGTFIRGKNELSVFYSNHSIDANIVSRDSLTNEVTEVTTLQTTGLHSTKYEITDENALKNKTLGGHYKYSGNYIELGFTAIYNTFSAKINPNPAPYNTHYFRGTENYNTGTNYRFRTGKILWFGEAAMSKSKSFAFLNGLHAQPITTLSISIIHRNYGKTYHSLYGNAFGENSRIQNEKGIYFGFKYNMIKYTTITGYADFFSFPEMKYGSDFPTQGYEYMGCVTFRPNSFFQTFIQYRIKQKETNQPLNDAPLAYITPTTKENLRIGLNYRATTNLNLSNRIEYVLYNKKSPGNTKGFFASQDVDYKFTSLPIRLYMRYAIFDTDDYDSRVYSYENDLLYTFSIPVFYDKGYRFSCMLKITPYNNADVWIKYILTQYATRETISSGLYEINGNKKQEIKVQAIFRFPQK